MSFGLRRAEDRVACSCGEGLKIVAIDTGDVVATVSVRNPPLLCPAAALLWPPPLLSLP